MRRSSAIPYGSNSLGARKKGINKRGARTKRWEKVWRWLKPRLEAAGRTGCEFGFIPHDCWQDFALDPCHSRKRRLWKGNDIYAVAMGCRIVHRILDEVYSQSEMEKAVWRAINANGGIIIP